MAVEKQDLETLVRKINEGAKKAHELVEKLNQRLCTPRPEPLAFPLSQK